MSDYRDAPAKCPACQELMEQRSLSEAMVDTCARCRGLWVDWFDGDLLSVVHEVAPLSLRPAVDVDPTRTQPCPRCSRDLTPETFGGSVLLRRCQECAGCFVPREAFTSLMELDLPAHSRHGADVEKQGALAKLLAAIRRFVGTDVTAPPVANYRAHLDVARAYKDRGLLDDALQELDIALKMQPGDEDARRLRDELLRKG